MTTFASFNYPRKLFTLPRGTLEQRKIDRRKPRVTGGYYQSEPHPNGQESCFYLNSDFMPGLRWDYAATSRYVRNYGWYLGGYEDETVSGIVMRLPHKRYIPGWTMGESMASGVEYKIFNDFDECAQYADEIARIYAETVTINERETLE